MNASRSLCMFLSFFFFIDIQAAVKGSETAVSIEPAYTFPAADIDNTMLGFGWFKQGFSLEDSSTTCTFDSVFPVSGSIDLNGGTLYLLQDLVLRNVLQLNELGTICGNQHILDICSIPCLPSGMLTLHDAKIELHQDLIITDTVVITGNCIIHAFGKVINLQNNGNFQIASDAHLSICDAEIRGIRDENIQCIDDTGSITLDNVKWIQDGFTEFAHGTILFKDHVEMIGSSTFLYSSMQTSTIGISSCLHIYSDMHFCLGRDPVTLNEPLAFYDSSSCLHLDDCNFVIADSGICFTKGTVTLAKEVTLDALGTTTQTGLILGDGSSEHDVTVWFEPGAAVTHNSGYWVYNNSRKDLLKSASKTSRMIRNLGSKIYVPKSLEINDITVQLNSNYVAPIEVEPSAQLSYLKAAVNLPDIDFDITSDQLNAYTYCLNGDDSLFLSKGVLPLYVVVTGTGNQIRGNGGLTGAITLMDANAQLVCAINGYIGNSVTLNEGTFALGYDLLMRRNAPFVGPGKITLGSNSIKFLCGASGNYPIYWEGEAGSALYFNSKISLTKTWTIKGDCRIVGDNAKLVLEEGGALVVEPNSSLTLKNISIFGLKDTNMRCIDDTGSIAILSTDLHLADDYLFANGSMKFYLKNSVSGAYTFSYDSAVASTIKSDGSVSFDDGIIVAIGRKNGVDQIVFEGGDSVLKFNNATLYAYETGLQLTKGKMILDGRVNLDIMGTTTQTGLIMGDGTADNDVEVVLSPAMVTSHNSGYWVYNNASANKIKSTSTAARLVRSGTSRIYLPKSLYAENFTVELTSLLVNPVEVDPGVLVSYAHAFVKMPTIEFDASCSQLNYYTYYLSGNNSIFITKGILPLYLLVQGIGNTLIGNGSLSGGIIFADAQSALLCGLGGLINNFINLNGSTLTLASDLYLGSNGSLNGPGVVDLGNNELTYAINTQNLNTPIYWISNGGGINVRGTVSLANAWTIKGTCKINGINSKFILNEDAEIIVEPNSQLILENMRLYGLKGENVRCVDDTGKITLINVELVQTDDVIFSRGSMEMYLKNLISGSYTFSYESVMTSTIKSDGQCNFKDGITFVCGRVSGNEPIYLENSTAIVQFQDSTLQVKETGMCLTRGTIVADRNVVVDVVGTNSTTGLIFGNGILEDDITLMLNPGCTARFSRGFVRYDITVPDGIQSKSKTAELIRGAASHFDLKHHVNLADMTVDVNSASLLTIDPGKLLSYTNGRIVLSQGTFDLSGVRYSDTTTLLNGDDKIVLINGSLPLATLVMGTNNSIEGNGTVTGPVILSDATAELTVNLNGYLFSNVMLNGGKLIFANDCALANAVLLSGDGTVQVGSNNLELGSTKLIWPGSVLWDMNGGSIGLYAMLDLQGTWTFKGVGEIKGYGQTINLSTGSIVVDEGSQLILSNVNIEQLNSNHVRCLGDDSVLILNNVTINQDDYFSFNQGALQFKNNVSMSGGGIFAYETNQTSTIGFYSTLRFDNGMTFSYDPSINSKDLLEFVNNSSQIILSSSTIHTTTVGINFKKGKMLVENDSSLYSEKVTLSLSGEEGGQLLINEGVAFGDSIMATNDFHVQVLQGVTLHLKHGKLVIRNIDSEAFVLGNAYSTLLIDGTTSLYIYENFDLLSGRIIFGDQAILGLITGNRFNASINPQGKLQRTSLT